MTSFWRFDCLILLFLGDQTMTHPEELSLNNTKLHNHGLDRLKHKQYLQSNSRQKEILEKPISAAEKERLLFDEIVKNVLSQKNNSTRIQRRSRKSHKG